MKFLGKRLNIIIGIMLVMIIIAFILPSQKIESQNIYHPMLNPQVQGWLFGRDSSFVGEKLWGYTGVVDTLLIPGIDTTCAVLLTPKTATGTLRADVATTGDTAFVTSTGSETADTDKYFYMVIRNAANATD